MIGGIELNETTHIYTLPSGVILPSVTEILKGCGIITSNYGFTEKTATRGHYAHTLCNYWLLGKLDESSIDPELAGYLESCKKFVAQTGFKLMLSEFNVYHSVFGYAGRCDALGILPDNRHVIIDWKTGDIQKWTGLQLGGYQQAIWEQKEYNNYDFSRYAVRLKVDGSLPEIKPFRDAMDMKVFIALNTCYKWKVNNGYIKKEIKNDNAIR